ncbi:MAG: WecB/TagA/CpsF family glycosyltransferase [Polyangiaceae bacterium]|jgi:N-acetylglucosaminyldiphosphoundecaprenol N-acetyl-beta-D-mannosaminyltransferase
MSGEPHSTHRERIRIGGLPIDAVTFAQGLDAIEALVTAREGGSVFTPNIDHIVQYSENNALRAAYETASLSLADGMPVVWSSKLLGTPLPAKISGSDLVVPLAERARARGWRLVLLGGAEGVAHAAAVRLTGMFPGLHIAATLSPRIDMSEPPATRGPLVRTLCEASAELIFVALGAPKQELFIAEVQPALRPAVLLGIGASLDFLAGTARRAPAWMSGHGLEWAYRLARDPRRMWKRYLLRDPKFAWILARSMWQRRV